MMSKKKKRAKSGNGQIEARDQCNFIVIAHRKEGRMPFINLLFFCRKCLRLIIYCSVCNLYELLKMKTANEPFQKLACRFPRD